jgi:hypothetical protein
MSNEYLARNIYERYSTGKIGLARSPAKSLLIRKEQEPTEKKMAEILSETKEERLEKTNPYAK